MTKTYRGSCTCGAVRFEADLELAKGTTRCNCSFCRKARMWFAIAPTSAVRLTAGEDALVDWQRTLVGTSEPFLHFTFCGTCGVRPFTRGGAMPGYPDGFYAVNVAALDDVTDDELATAPIHFADGAHDDWQAQAAQRFL